jgi:uncharacterized SAM-binding protein YcdF (DUF218 family)
MRSVVGYGFLAPPNVFIALCLLGAIVALIWRRVGITITLAVSLCLFVTATPAFAACLLVWLEADIQQETDFSSAEAIVVLGADVRAGGDAGPDRLGPQSLERLIFAADAYKQLHLPVAVSGGRLPRSRTSVAGMMKVALEQYFAVPVTWSEDRSRTTYENVVYTTQLLQKANIRTVVVIAQARDTPRAIWCFERVGLRAIPWPAPRTSLKIDRIADFLPSTGALDASFYALHELIGGLYYRMHY